MLANALGLAIIAWRAAIKFGKLRQALVIKGQNIQRRAVVLARRLAKRRQMAVDPRQMLLELPYIADFLHPGRSRSAANSALVASNPSTPPNTLSHRLWPKAVVSSMANKSPKISSCPAMMKVIIRALRR